jgi:N-acetylmuramoyl-L-alanine amidase
MANYSLKNGIHIVEIPTAEFAIQMVDQRKKSCGTNVANAGFFAGYKEQGDSFTLPVAHLVCDYAAESPHTWRYCQERGRFNGEKFSFDSSTWSYMNPFVGKAISTLIIHDGKAEIRDIRTLPDCEYAISGVPIMRDGEDVKFATYVKGQGWDASSLYATWHTFLGLKDDRSTVFLMAMKTTTVNMVLSAEAYKKFKALGFLDVIKLDGGGSFYLNADGKTVSTLENRRINSIITFNTQKKPQQTEGVDRKLFKIALGAGHDIETAGKRCLKALDPNETREWFLNDRICDYIESYLKSYEGYSILRLDDSDDGKEDIPLATRTDKANQWGADFYLSIHHNAGINGGSGGGIVAYTHPQSSKTSVEWRDALYDALIQHTGLKGNRNNPKPTSDLFVLRKSAMPAVLLELGFMDSKTDVPIILTESYAKKCAQAIVEVIVARAGLKKKVIEPEPVYKVQVGVFSKRDYAEKLQKELTAKGYQVYIVKE